MDRVLISLHPQWCNLILKGEKTIEVRKRAPKLEPPFEMLLYCTQPKDGDVLGIKGSDGKVHKANGKVCGKVTCIGIVEVKPPFKDKCEGTCLTAKQLYDYIGVTDKLYFMKLAYPVRYDEPHSLEEIGVSSPPQSWRYIREYIERVEE